MTEPANPTPAAPEVSAPAPVAPAAPASLTPPAAAAQPATPPPDPMAGLVGVLAGFQSTLDKLAAKLDAPPAPAPAPATPPPAAAAPATPPAAPAPAAPAAPAGLDPMTKLALQLHLGELKSPDYANLLPQGIKANADGTLSPADKALADEWKRQHPDLFRLATSTSTPAGGSPSAPPVYTEGQLAFFRRNNIDPATINERPMAKMLVPVLGWNSKVTSSQAVS